MSHRRAVSTVALLTTLNFEIWTSYFFNVLAPWSAYTISNFEFSGIFIFDCLDMPYVLAPWSAYNFELWISNFHVTCFPCSRAHIVIHEISVKRLLENYCLTRVIEASMYILNPGLRVQAFRKKEMMWGSGPDHVCHTSWRGVWPAPTYIMYLSPWP